MGWIISELALSCTADIKLETSTTRKQIRYFVLLRATIQSLEHLLCGIIPCYLEFLDKHKRRSDNYKQHQILVNFSM